MFSKLFKRNKDFKPLAVNKGGCLATNRITIDGEKVGYMYRGEPGHELDNGWRFFAGDENQEYIDNLDNTHPYDTNTIANLDPAIVPYLDEPLYSAFERIPNTDKFKRVADQKEK